LIQQFEAGLKKLDKLIIKSFIGPFVAVFFITVFVLVMQFFWLWVDDFVGKGLDAFTILKFVWFKSAELIPLALPLAVLLSSLMTFGNLGETFELVAIKSAGISLLRFMAPLFVVSSLISVGAFLFSNYVIPIANLKSRTLLADIVLAKPAFNIKEGVFYDQLDGFSIKIGKKENDSIIRDIIVYEQGNSLQDNFIIAKDGIMKPSPDKHFLDFHLKNGIRYMERGSHADSTTEYIRMSFKEYKKQFDISSFNFKASADSNNRNNERVYSIRQLGVAIDSIGKLNKSQKKFFNDNLLSGLTLLTYRDSVTKIKIPDSLVNIKAGIKNVTGMVPDSAKKMVNDRAISVINSMKTNIDMNGGSVIENQKNLNRYKIEWHKKLALSLACLVLFLIGAPLGSIIRKGGLGTPLIFAIVFFLLFYFSSNTGEKLAKEGTWTPFSGLWFSTFILVPIGFFLIYKAMRDSNLFSKEFYGKLRRGILKKIGKERDSQ
jgi:lipopolysaccharide export system permease protein